MWYTHAIFIFPISTYIVIYLKIIAEDLRIDIQSNKNNKQKKQENIIVADQISWQER